MLACVHLRDERAIMRWALGVDQLVGGRDAIHLELLLERALGVLRLLGKLDGHARDERALDELLGSFDAAIQIQRGHHGLIHVLERRMQAATPRARLRGAEHDDVSEAEVVSRLRQAGA